MKAIGCILGLSPSFMQWVRRDGDLAATACGYFKVKDVICCYWQAAAITQIELCCSFCIFAVCSNQSSIEKDNKNYSIAQQSSHPIFLMAIHPFLLLARFASNWSILTPWNLCIQEPTLQLCLAAHETFCLRGTILLIYIEGKTCEVLAADVGLEETDKQ